MIRIFLCFTSYSDLQQEINFETNIPPKDQFIHYEECMLLDIVSDSQPICKYPKMSQSTPLVLIRSTAEESCIMPEEKFWYNEPFFGKLS